MPEKARVLFVCIENSCRSQMAEAFAHLQADDRIEAFSAGSRPAGRVDPKAVAAMAELGYDLGGHRSKSLDEIPKVKYDYVITMGCGDECPFIPAGHHEDWEIPDPKALPLDEFRKVRDLIEERVKELATRL
jgi:protein-tyrosine-phosphatase